MFTPTDTDIPVAIGTKYMGSTESAAHYGRVIS